MTKHPVRTKLLVNKNRRTTISISIEKGNKNRLIYHIITWVQNASQNESGLVGGVTCLHNNGSRSQLFGTVASNHGNRYVTLLVLL